MSSSDLNNSVNSPSSDEHIGTPRVHEEGRQNYERNNKSSDWFVHHTEVMDVKSDARLKIESIKAMAEEKRRSGQEELVRSQTFNGHEQSEGASITNQFNGDVEVNSLAQNYERLEVAQPAVVKQPTADTEVHSGLGSASSPTSPATEKPTPPSELRLDLQAGQKKDKQREERSGKPGQKTSKQSKQGRLHQESSSGGWDQNPPPNRLRAEGEGIARKNKTDSITELFHQSNGSQDVRENHFSNNSSGSVTPDRPTTPRVRLDGIQNLQRAMNHGEMSDIMHGKPVDLLSPRAHGGRGESLTSAQKDRNHLEMSDIMHGKPVGSAAPHTSSGRRALPHMQKSELW